MQQFATRSLESTIAAAESIELETSQTRKIQHDA